MKVTSSEFQQNIGRFQDTAMTEPVIITKHGRPHNVLISAAMFDVLTKGRVARSMDELDNEALRAIAEAEVPAHYAHLDQIDLEEKR